MFAVSLLVAVTLALNLSESVVDNATPVAVVVCGVLMRVARLALVASTFTPIRTLPAVVPIDETKVKVTHCITTVSFAVGCVARASTAEQVRLLVEYNL